ncbi:DNA topoisomerase I, mitochondrial isoform X1 [Tachysurus ichikawai]
MPGLTAKVFRTYNASMTLQQQLKELSNLNAVKCLAERAFCFISSSGRKRLWQENLMQPEPRRQAKSYEC